MALDIGEKRVGVAICDAKETVASAICVLDAQDVFQVSRHFKTVLENWEPERFLVGKPRTLDGDVGPQAKRVEEIAKTISDKTGIDIEFFDERLSSKEAKNFMRECGMTERDMRGKIDMIAAQIFLQTFLDRKKNALRVDSNEVLRNA